MFEGQQQRLVLLGAVCVTAVGAGILYSYFNSARTPNNQPQATGTKDTEVKTKSEHHGSSETEKAKSAKENAANKRTCAMEMNTVELRGFPRSFLKHAPINGAIDLANTAKDRVAALAAPFGSVKDVIVMFRARAALVQFSETADAAKMVATCAKTPLLVPTLTKLQQKAPPVGLIVKLTQQRIFREDHRKMNR